MTMTIGDLITLQRMVDDHDPRPVDTAALANLLFRHLMYGGFVSERDQDYLESYFNTYLRRAIKEDRESRMIHEALKP